MYARQKVLLYSAMRLGEQNGHLSKTYLDKFLFVLGKESEIGRHVRFYGFYPHLYGPYSNQFSLDLAELQSLAFIDKDMVITHQGERAISSVSGKIADVVNAAAERLRGVDIIRYVYDAYPQYASRSRLKKQVTVRTEPGIFSIGYEGYNIDSFLDVLIQNRIEMVADLRHNPFSMNLAFTKSRLERYLRQADIDYRHMPGLGIDGRYRKGLNNDEDYQRLFDFYSVEILPGQEEQIRALAGMGRTMRIAMLCFEHDKDRCHRGVVSRELEKASMEVNHL